MGLWPHDCHIHRTDSLICGQCQYVMPEQEHACRTHRHKWAAGGRWIKKRGKSDWQICQLLNPIFPYKLPLYFRPFHTYVGRPLVSCTSSIITRRKKGEEIFCHAFGIFAFCAYDPCVMRMEGRMVHFRREKPARLRQNGRGNKYVCTHGKN